MKEFNFSKKRKAQLYTIVTTMLLCVSACAFSNFDTYADDTIDFVSVYGFDDFYLESDSGINSLNNWSTSDNPYGVGYVIDKWNYFLNNDTALNHMNISNNHILDTSIFNNYAIFTYRSYRESEDGCYFYIYQLPEDSMIFSDVNSGNIIMIPYDIFINNSINDYYAQYAQFYGSNYSAYSRQSASNILSFSENSLYYCDGVAYIGIYSYPNAQNVGDWGMDNIPYYMNSTVPVYYYDDISSIPHQFSTSNLDNVNPNSSSGISDDDILNNDYLGENNCILMDASSLENGKWSVYLDWNENQLENLDDYQVNATFELTGNVTFDGNANDYTDICVTYYGLTPNESGSYILDKTFSSTSSLSGIDDISSITFQFSQINDGLKNGSKGVTPFVQMVDKMRGTSGTDGVKSGTSNFFNRLFSGTYFGFRIPLYSNTENKINYNTLNYTCTVDVINKSTGKSILTNPLVQPYNMLTGQAGTFVNGGVDQDTVNQVVTDNLGNTSGYQGTIEVSNGGSGGNASGGSSNNTNSGNNNNSSIESGAIVINNNPTFNNDVSSKSESSAGLGSNLLTTILKYIIGSKGTSVDMIDDLADSTGWFNIVNQTYTFVPTAFWNLIITCFTVCLGIVIVTFIISMVIKIIT